LWRCENEYRASILIPSTFLNKLPGFRQGRYSPCQPIGSSIPHEKTFPAAFIYKETGQYKLILTLDLDAGSPAHPYLVRLVPFNPNTVVEKCPLEFETRNLSEPLILPNNLETISGMIYLILQSSSNDVYDLQEPFPPLNHLWDIEPVYGRRVDSMTSKELVGRQDFSDVCEPDGSLAITALNSRQSVFNHLLSGNVEGFFLDRKTSLRIESALDLLRFKAVMKAKSLS
jgi:hypothetical protein